MKFEVTIEELLSRTIEVEAETEAEAFEKVLTDYKNEDIVLNTDDHVLTSIKDEDGETIFELGGLVNENYCNFGSCIKKRDRSRS